MTSEEDEAFIEVDRRVRIMNDRGNASLYAKEIQDDQVIIEKSVTQDWLLIANKKLALGITDWFPNPEPKEPPDIFGYIGEKKISIECTEFVDGDLLDRLKSKEINIHAGIGFKEAQWTECDFIAHLNECISKKEEKYSKNNIVIDFLLIHSDEHWLYPGKVNDWISRFNRRSNATIDSAYFLMSYDPQIKTYPVFKLF